MTVTVDPRTGASIMERSKMDDQNEVSEFIEGLVIIDPPTSGPGDDPRKAIWFPVNDVRIDQRVQRTTLPGRVEELSETWDFNKAEAITITIREDDTLVVTEGQTRVLSRKATHPGSHMWGVISTDSNESRVALGIARGRKPLTPYDKWRLRKHDQDPKVLAAEQVLSLMDPPLQLFDRVGKSGYGIAAVGAVDRIMNTYEEVPASALLLRTILRVLTKAWPSAAESRRLDGRLIEALRYLMVENADVIDTERLIEVLQTKPALRWYQYGIDRSVAETAYSAVGREIVKVYNFRKQSRRIEWA